MKHCGICGWSGDDSYTQCPNAANHRTPHTIEDGDAKDRRLFRGDFARTPGDSALKAAMQGRLGMSSAARAARELERERQQQFRDEAFKRATNKPEPVK